MNRRKITDLINKGDARTTIEDVILKYWESEPIYATVALAYLDDLLSDRKALADRDTTIAEMREALEGIQALAPDKATHIHAICENILAKYPQKGK